MPNALKCKQVVSGIETEKKEGETVQMWLPRLELASQTDTETKVFTSIQKHTMVICSVTKSRSNPSTYIQRVSLPLEDALQAG